MAAPLGTGAFTEETGQEKQGPQEKDRGVCPERAEEAKLKAKYPSLGQKPGGSDFLMKRLQKGAWLIIPEVLSLQAWLIPKVLPLSALVILKVLFLQAWLIISSKLGQVFIRTELWIISQMGSFCSPGQKSWLWRPGSPQKSWLTIPKVLADIPKSAVSVGLADPKNPVSVAKIL